MIYCTDGEDLIDTKKIINHKVAKRLLKFLEFSVSTENKRQTDIITLKYSEF